MVKEEGMMINPEIIIEMLDLDSNDLQKMKDGEYFEGLSVCDGSNELQRKMDDVGYRYSFYLDIPDEEDGEMVERLAFLGFNDVGDLCVFLVPEYS